MEMRSILSNQKKYRNIANLLFSKKKYYFWIQYDGSCKPILLGLQLLLF